MLFSALLCLLCSALIWSYLILSDLPPQDILDNKTYAWLNLDHAIIDDPTWTQSAANKVVALKTNWEAGYKVSRVTTLSPGFHHAHCQSVTMLSPHCHHTVATLPPHCYTTVAILSPHYHHRSTVPHPRYPRSTLAPHTVTTHCHHTLTPSCHHLVTTLSP